MDSDKNYYAVIFVEFWFLILLCFARGKLKKDARALTGQITDAWIQFAWNGNYYDVRQQGPGGVQSGCIGT